MKEEAGESGEVTTSFILENKRQQRDGGHWKQVGGE